MKLPSKKSLIYGIPKPIRSFATNRVLPNLPKAVSWRIKQATRVPSAARLLKGGRARDLEAKLWGGYSAQALKDLESIRYQPTATKGEIFHAARALSSWYASHNKLDAAYEHAVMMRLVGPATPRDHFQVLMEAECLIAKGQTELARIVLGRALERDPDNADLCLVMANSYFPDGLDPVQRDELRLAWINRPFIANGLAALKLLDPLQELSIGNLGGVDASPPADGAALPKVSILIPAYNSEDTLRVAVRSLLQQTLTNIEILVVDDCSTDGTFELIRKLADEDPRVVPLRNERNSGAYVARNHGLRHATGEFVTVHDADDWSHPQRLEVQLRHMVNHPHEVATATDWIRCVPGMLFRPPARAQSVRVLLNSASLLIRRQLMLELGGWDEVRIGADSEFARRMRATIGVEARLHRHIPLAFAMERADSLTRQSITHVNTLTHGVRRVYHEAAAHWLKSSESKPLALPGSGKRAFPAPGFILPERRLVAELDIMFVMDMRMEGGAFTSTLNYILAAAKMGLRVGVLHWRRYDLDASRPPAHPFMQAVQDGLIYRVSPGETVKADAVVVGYPVILNHPIDLPPIVECNHLAIVVNQMSSRLLSGGDVQYDPLQVAKVARQAFNQAPVWIPISDLVRGLMGKDGRYHPIHTQTWNPLIDADEWLAVPRKWRAGGNRQPVVGRHARDHYTKWPTEADAIRGAYCVDRPCEVELLGGAGEAIKILDQVPGNWTVHPYGTVEARAFLDGLDVWVHFPHEDYIEEFGRAVIEAMAVGVPVILPPVFRQTFGEAALYAEPSEVWELVNRLWTDEAFWLERVRVGREFVRVGCGWERFEERLALLRCLDTQA